MLGAWPRWPGGETLSRLCFALVVAFCLVAGEAQAAGLRVGLVANTQGWNANAGREQSLAARTEVGWLREEFNWNEIEASRGNFDWSRYDRVFEAAARRGLRVLPLLSGSADWAAASSNSFPDDDSDYARYLSRVVARYGPGGQFWAARRRLAAYAPTHFELWNEPYIEGFSVATADPGRYARLVKTAVAAARQANPWAKFVIAADTTSTGADQTTSWIDAMYAAVPDLNLFFDAVAVHPYSSRNPPWLLTPTENRWQFRRMELMRQRFAAHGDNSPFWITELGWSTCTEHPDCVSEAEQATYLQSAFGYAFATPWLEALFVYHLRDWGPDEPSEKEYWFGLLRKADQSPKPAWSVLRAAALRAKPAPVPPPPPAAGPQGQTGLIRLVRPKRGRVPVTRKRLRLKFRCTAEACPARRFSLRSRRVRRVLTVARFDKAGSRRRKVRLSRPTVRKVRRAGRRGLLVKVRGAGASVRGATRLRLVARQPRGRRR